MSHNSTKDFQKYRAPQDPLLEEEDITTRSEPSFNDNDSEVMPEHPIATSSEEMAVLLKAINRLLQDKEAKPKIQVRAPDTFHGERSAAAVDGWIASLERYADLVGSDEITQVQFAANLLRGEAEVWWRQQERYSGIITDWAIFRKLFIEEFKSINATQTARDKLAALQQVSTVSAYVAAFRSLRIELPTMTDEEALDRFTRGLQPEVRAHVVTRYPAFCAEAERMALAFESAQQIQTTVVAQTNSSYSPSPSQRATQNYIPEYMRSTGVAPMDLDAAQLRPQQGWRPGGRQEPWRQGDRQNRQQTPSDRCYNCSGFGHMARDCPSPRRPRHNDRNQV